MQLRVLTLAAVIKKARAAKRPVLIDLGGNWCGDCRVFAGVLEQPEVKRWFDKLKGVPPFLVVDAKGKLVNDGAFFALTDARHAAVDRGLAGAVGEVGG
uniref:thioredoxin family protein n=1 Tax=uncultured Caulobacter sp. TaxID=158749 RepID=UPI0025F9A5AC|nr:thioredoxin family protein [uncultured Caulobacter sp.]